MRVSSGTWKGGGLPRTGSRGVLFPRAASGMSGASRTLWRLKTVIARWSSEAIPNPCLTVENRATGAFFSSEARAVDLSRVRGSDDPVRGGTEGPLDGGAGAPEVSQEEDAEEEDDAGASREQFRGIESESPVPSASREQFRGIESPASGRSMGKSPLRA